MQYHYLVEYNLNPTEIWWHQENGLGAKFDKNKTLWASVYVFGPDGEWIEFTFSWIYNGNNIFYWDIRKL